MENKKVAKRYAEAIFEVAKNKNQIFECLEVLDILLRHIKEDSDFNHFLTYPMIDKSEKKKLIEKIYDDINNQGVIDIIEYLIDKDRLSYIYDIRNEYANIYYELHQKIIVTAIFAKEITEEQKEKLINQLEKRKNKKIILDLRIDPTIIAGGILRINDEVLDGSIKKQIKDFKNMF